MLLGVGEVQENKIVRVLNGDGPATLSTSTRDQLLWGGNVQSGLVPWPVLTASLVPSRREFPYYCSQLSSAEDLERNRLMFEELGKTISDKIASGQLSSVEIFLRDLKSGAADFPARLSQIQAGCVGHPYYSEIPRLRKNYEYLSKLSPDLEAKFAQAKAKRDGTQPPAGDAGAGAGAGAVNGSIVPGVSNMALLSLAAVGAFLFLVSSKD